jgi:hypothetical protein
LTEEEFNKIPRDILEAKAAEGIRKHKILEDNYGKPNNNLLSYMFDEGLKKIFTEDELQGEPTFEKQLNGLQFTGKPDFYLRRTLIDYKFTDTLRPETALQLILYGILQNEVSVSIDRFYAFHFPNDYSLFIYQIPGRALAPLKEFASFVIDNHEAIDAGGFEKYEGLIKWKKLLIDYEVFEPVDAVFPPLTITDQEKADFAAVIYYKIKRIEDYKKYLNSELKRYMEEKGETRLGNSETGGVRLQNHTTKVYDPKEYAIAKAAWDKAREDCKTAEVVTKKIVRFGPKQEPIKQLN